jgi:hypothetical protein
MSKKAFRINYNYSEQKFRMQLERSVNRVSLTLYLSRNSRAREFRESFTRVPQDCFAGVWREKGGALQNLIVGMFLSVLLG